MARQITLSHSQWTFDGEGTTVVNASSARIWYDAATEKFYSSDSLTSEVTSIRPPERTDYTFCGYWSATQNWTGRFIDENGEITDFAKDYFRATAASTTAITITCYGRAATDSNLRTVTINATYFKGGPARFYYSPQHREFYSDQGQSVAITSLAQIENANLPALECWSFDGCFGNNANIAASGVAYVDPDGSFLDELKYALDGRYTTSLTVYPRGTMVSNKVILNVAGGVAPEGYANAIYRKVNGGGYYTTDLCEEGTDVSSLPTASLPTKSGSAFAGYWNATGTATTSGTRYISHVGALDVAQLETLAHAAVPSAPATKSVTINARYVAACVITANAYGGEHGTGTFYYSTVRGAFYSDAGLTQAVAQIAPHDRECYLLLGYWPANSTSGARLVDELGNLSSDMSSSGWDITESVKTKAIHAQWDGPKTCIIELSLNGGGVRGDSPEKIYMDLSVPAAPEAILDSTGVGSPIDGIETPSRDGYKFVGFFRAASGTSDRYIDKDGHIGGSSDEAKAEALAALAGRFSSTTTKITIYAKWVKLFKIEIRTNATTSTTSAANYGTAAAGTESIWYLESETEGEQGTFYLDSGMNQDVGALSPVTLPTCRCFACEGLFDSAGNLRIDSSGLPESTFKPTGNTTLFAHWGRRCYLANLMPNGGEGEPFALFHDGQQTSIFSDEDLSVPAEDMDDVAGFDYPTRAGYNFDGYMTTASGHNGARIITADGTVSTGTPLGQRDLELYARWDGREYTLNFSIAHGSASPAQKTVKMGVAIGNLPSVTIAADTEFQGWVIDGSKISPTTIWIWPSDMTAVALLFRSFGSVNDYFGYGGANLVPIESDSGEDMPRIVTRHYGKFRGGNSGSTSFNGADAASSLVWQNPTVKYMVVGSVNFPVQLGRAFAGATGYTGYMITSVTIETRRGRFPTITVRATANEGANAINQFDIGTFGNTVSVLPRARAQALLGGIHPGTGHLHACTLQVACDPVVLAENMVPCASDVVNGRIEVSADVFFPDIRNRTIPDAGSGYSLVSREETHGGTAYNGYRIAARKEL